MVDINGLVAHIQGAGLDLVVVDENTVFETPSPFLPNSNVQYAWDATSLENLKRCPRLYQLVNIEGWRSREENVNLRFGAEFHKAAQIYYRLKAENVSHEKALHTAVKEILINTAGWQPEHKTKSRDSLLRTIIGYFEKFKDETAETLIMPNGEPAVEVNFHFELDYGPTPDQPYILCGYLDRVVNFNGETFFRDYKTTVYQPNDRYFAQFSPHNQMTLYTIACKVIFETVIKGGIIDAAQVKVDDTEYGQGFTFRTEDQLQEWLKDLRYVLEEAETYVQDNHWPMRDTSCDKYGGCQFRGICTKSPKAREAFLASKFVKEERWNPLKPR